MNSKIIKILILIYVSLFLYRCNKNTPTESRSLPVPQEPILSKPKDGSTIIDNTPIFRWGVVSNSAQYRIQIDDDMNFNSLVTDEYLDDVTYTPSSGLSDGTYYWRVAAKNSDGLWGKESSVWKFIILTQGPSAPNLSSPTNNEIINDNTPTFVWTGVNSAVKYQLQVDNNSDFSTPEIDIISNNLNYTPSAGLTNGIYYWRVRCADQNNLWGSYSNSWSFDVLYSWVSKPSMPTSRAGLAAGVVYNKIYCIGGFYGGPNPFSTNEEYDPVTNIWTTKEPMPTARSGFAIGVVNKKLYAIGGEDSYGTSSKNEEYDPATNSWRSRSDILTGRSNFAIGVVNNRIYAIGGIDSSYFTNVNEEYDPVTDSWQTKANFFWSRWYHAAAVVNGKIYIIGGVSDENEVYDPIANSWETKSPMPNGSYRTSLAAGVVNNKIYAIGGGFSTQERTANLEYDPATDIWTNKESMPTGRERLAIGVVNGKIYAIGGSNNNGYLSTNEEYDPALDN